MDQSQIGLQDGGNISTLWDQELSPSQLNPEIASNQYVFSQQDYFEEEFEIASVNEEVEEVKKEFEYEAKNEKFRNPFVITMPDGRVQIATQSLPPNIVKLEILS